MHRVGVLFLGVMLLFPIFVISYQSAFSQQEKGPNVDQVRFIHYEQEAIALEAVKSGEIDAYHFRIPLESVSDARNDPTIKIYERIAGSNTLLLNPAPSKDGSTINPFQFREVRFAMNYLVDREFIVKEILRGYGNPLIDPFGTYSPEYLNIIDVVESFGFRHNPQLADKMISDALTKAGATKEEGKWMFNGNPVIIKIMIRQDDLQRKALGEDVSSKLESIGFTMEKSYGDLTTANAVVSGSDPQDFQWHIYTEGFAGTSAFVKYNPVIPAQMYAPWYGFMPGAQNPSFWQYQNSTLDEVTSKILFFNFTSDSERTELVREAVEMGIQESVRIFLMQRTDPFVASSSLNGLVNDFGAGITSKYAFLNAKPAEGNSLDIGVKQIHQGSWNTREGLKDTYSREIYSLIADLGTARDPYTGNIVPERTQWTDIVTEGPLERLQVPDDILKWDPASQEWKQVKPEEAAKSKVTYKILYSNWHNGIPMDESDLLYADYFAFEWGTDLGESDLTKDPEYTSRVSEGLKYSNGTKFIEPNVVETYVDIWHFDETEIADSAAPWAIEPWEITAATERLVVDNQLAYSRSEATAKGIEWLDPVIVEHADMIKQQLQKMKDENYMPVALADFVSIEDAKKRYDASIRWIDEHRHAIISNGSFYLDNYNAAGGTIIVKAFRDPTYPFEVGHWASYQEPMLTDIVKVDFPRSVTIGQVATGTVSVEIGDQPSNEALIDYFVSDKDGTVVAKGKGQPEGNVGSYKIDLFENDTSKLSPGTSQLKVFANSPKAFRPDIVSTTFFVASATQSGNNQTSTPGSTGPSGGGGCLIATAAFGSELTPQVQYLRNFRENYILSTVSGAAFMNTFNSIYYSFSPQVADYERDQPWLQTTVKTMLYPLFGILTLSERAHFAASGGEPGALATGAMASMMIGAVYLWPAAISSKLQSRFGKVSKISLAILLVSLVLTIIGILAGNVQFLSVSTALFVLSSANFAAIVCAKMVRMTAEKMLRNRRRY